MMMRCEVRSLTVGVKSIYYCFSSVQFSRSVVSDSLRPLELQHASPPCPSLTPGVHPNLCPLSRWCHPTISSSVVPFSSCPQSFWASGSSPVSQLFTSGGQSTGVSGSASVLPMIFRTDFRTDIQDELVGSPYTPRDSQKFSPTPQCKSINSSVLSFVYSPTLTSIHDYWKNHSFKMLCWNPLGSSGILSSKGPKRLARCPAISVAGQHFVWWTLSFTTAQCQQTGFTAQGQVDQSWVQ